MSNTLKTHKPLECSHVESGACRICKDPLAFHPREDYIATRTATVRKDTNRAPATDPILKLFMTANQVERARSLIFSKSASGRRRNERVVLTSDLLYT